MYLASEAVYVARGKVQQWSALSAAQSCPGTEGRELRTCHTLGAPSG